MLATALSRHLLTMEALKKHLAVPDWVKTSAREFDSWKVVIRTAVAFFAAFVIILPNPSLNVLGNAAFLYVQATDHKCDVDFA